MLKISPIARNNYPIPRGFSKYTRMQWLDFVHTNYGKLDLLVATYIEFELDLNINKTYCFRYSYTQSTS